MRTQSSTLFWHGMKAAPTAAAHHLYSSRSVQEEGSPVLVQPDPPHDAKDHWPFKSAVPPAVEAEEDKKPLDVRRIVAPLSPRLSHTHHLWRQMRVILHASPGLGDVKLLLRDTGATACAAVDVCHGRHGHPLPTRSFQNNLSFEKKTPVA